MPGSGPRRAGRCLSPGSATSSFKRSSPGRRSNRILCLFDVIQELGECGDLEMLHQKTVPGDRDRRRLVFSTPWHEFKVMFLHLGFTDASTAVGHMRAVS